MRITADLFPEGAARRHFVGRFSSLMTLSVLIAVLGLLADSTAVVIGAMLVAPLMAPVLAMAAAIVRAWPGRLGVMFLITLAGTSGAVVLAALTSWLVPGSPDPLPHEIVARTAPNLLDLGIALVAGTVGAYSRSRRQAADAITGVAVAVALVPPLASAGILLELGLYRMAGGALLLFLANVVGIVMSASVTLIATGYVPTHQLLDPHTRIASGLRLSVAAVLVVTLPLAFGYRATEPSAQPTPSESTTIDQAVDRVDPHITVVEAQLVESNDGAVIDLVVTRPPRSTAPVDTDEVAEILADELEQSVELRIQTVPSNRSRATVKHDD
ncbi:MAG: DUF389 domain-containing protein [Acidimicrobiales bacterium]